MQKREREWGELEIYGGSLRGLENL